jgi:hypothetical protein
VSLRADTLGRLLAIVLAGTPAVAAAQASPTAPPHPGMPWSGITTPYGQLIRHVYVPPRPVTLQYLVQGPPAVPVPAEPPAPAAEGDTQAVEPPAPAAAAEPTATVPQVLSQQVTVPGYYVRETTTGYHYPERWTIEQTGPNAYHWRRLPAQFVPR